MVVHHKPVALALFLAGSLIALPTVDVKADDSEGYSSIQLAQASSRDRKKNTSDRRSDKRKADKRDDRRDDRRDDHRDDRRHDRRDDYRDDRRHDRRDDRWERYWKYRIGLRLLTLPLRHSRVVIGPTVYYYSSGVYYVQQGGAYIVVGAPIGGRIGLLPYGFRSLYIGPRRYFFVNSTYYLYAPATHDYVVVAKPAGVETAATAETRDPIVYPAAGQSEEQIDKDRYECHRWALDESGFDPTAPLSSDQADSDRYYRSIEACLSGRGYTLG